MAELVVFCLVGALSLGSAVSVVLLRNTVHAALMLVINFFTIAVFYAVLEAQFLATVQIIVYAGAIMVLFLFVIMLLGVDRQDAPTVNLAIRALPDPRRLRGEADPRRLRGQGPAAVILGLALFAVLGFAVAGPYMQSRSACPAPSATANQEFSCRGLAAANDDGNVQGVGALLFGRYVWPFEVMSVLLVIAAIGAMVLGRRAERPEDLVDPDEAPSRTPVPAEEPAPARQAGGGA